jgi:hypothetical protein
MKKILFILSFILLGVTSGYSQLDITSQRSTAPEKVLNLRGTTILLNYAPETIGYYLFLETDNQFDKGVLLSLGTDAEKAILTLKDMISLIDNHVANTDISNGTRPISLSNYEWNKNYLYIQQKYNAGSTMISKKELEKLIKAIQKRENISD